MEGKTEEEVQRYAKVFKERYKELSGKAITWQIYNFNSICIYILETAHSHL